MTPKRQRMIFIICAMLCLGGAVGLVLVNFQDNLVFFYSPSEIQEKEIPAGKRIRVGGLVEEGSIESPFGGNSISFVLTDKQADITVHYEGILPDLFREGQGMVANGVLQADGIFKADELLAKHDENYMPKEVADSLKESGYWQHDGTPNPSYKAE